MRKWYAPFWMSGILVLASAAGLWGCGSYEKAETVSEQGAEEIAETSEQNQETDTAPAAQSSLRETEMTQAKLPEFDPADETVYVTTEDGGG